jgi:hypothetical protein
MANSGRASLKKFKDLTRIGEPLLCWGGEVEESWL